MTLSQLHTHQRVLPTRPSRSSANEIDLQDPQIQRTLSRRRLLRAAAGLSAGALLAGGMSFGASAQEGGDAPQPIPGGLELGGVLFHVYLPVPEQEPSSVGSFRGVVALAEIVGMGTTNDGQRLPFVADQRFMTGQYVGMDGNRYKGSFGFL